MPSDTIDPARPSAGTAIVACHECGLVHRMRRLPEGGSAKCTRCGAALYQRRADSIERALMLTLAALILYVVANAFPFMTLKLEGREQASALITGVQALYREGMWHLAILVFLVAILAPLLKLLTSLYVLLPLHFGYRPWRLATIFRWTEGLRPWAMMEVFLLGIIVAYVKLSDLATIELNVALYAFVALIIVMAAADAALEPHAVWERIGPQARTRALADLQPGTLVSCHGCGQICRRSSRRGHVELDCPRCGAALHTRKTNSITRTWALLIAACILYIPANLLPIMTVKSLGSGHPDTILSGVKTLIQAGMWPVAALVFFASITVPVLKLITMFYLLISVQRRSRRRLRDRTVLYRVVEAVGRWSMVDIFMIAILVALVNLGAIATIEPGAGAVAFASVVIITMIAAMNFDPRLIWDAEEETDDARQPIRA